MRPVDLGFWDAIDRLVAECRLVIDRPAGSRHPRFPEVVFPIDYGYLEGTTTSDGEGIDVWIGSTPGRRVTGVACTMDFLKRDLELKILLACTREEMARIREFHNTEFQRGWLIERPPHPTGEDRGVPEQAGGSVR